MTKKRAIVQSQALVPNGTKWAPYFVFALVFLLFLPGTWFGFINMDDLALIAGNWILEDKSILDLDVIFKNNRFSPHYKPMVYLSWMIEKTIVGEVNPHVIHFNNALLHGINSALVFVLTRKLLPLMWPSIARTGMIALLCALIWGVHPMRIESVTWAIERKDVLFGMFYLLACLSYIKHLSSGRKAAPLALATLFYLLSCLSKSMGITFFATAILLEVLITPKSFFSSKGLLSKAPLLVILLLTLHLTGIIFAPPLKNTRIVNSARENAYVPDDLTGGSGIVQFVGIANARTVGLAAHTLLPVKLAIVYPREQWMSALGSFIYALLAVPLFFLALLYLKKPLRRNLGFGIAWYVITLSPILIADGTGTNFLSDRYTYIPSLGLIWFLIPWLNTQFSTVAFKKLTLGELISIAIILLLSVSTTLNIQHWRNSTALWNNMIEKYPVNWYGYYNRAKLTANTAPEQALDDMNKAIEHLPNQGMMYYARGTLYMNAGQQDEALLDFTRALELDPADAEARVNRGNIYRARKEYDLAIQDFTAAMEDRQFRNKALNNRGLTYVDVGNTQQAIADYTRCIKEFPGYFTAYLNRANLFVRGEIGRFDEAISDYTVYLRVNTKSHEALFRRGYAEAQLKRHERAITDITAAIEIEPNQGFYYFGRAQSREQIGQRQAALADLNRAESLGVRVDPSMKARLAQ